MKELQTKDVIAVLLIVCFVFLRFNGLADDLDALSTGLIGYYFGGRIQKKEDGS